MIGKTSRLALLIVLATLGSGWLSQSQAAEIFVAPEDAIGIYSNALVISGEIEQGDFEKMISEIKLRKVMPGQAVLSSPGGDVIAAMEIGRFFRESLITAFVYQETCNSSCVLILLGAPVRAVVSPIGIHRPYYNREYFSKLSATQASEKYRELDLLVRTYLSDMDISDSAIERMMAIKSSDVEFVPQSEFIEQFGLKAPAFEEWLLAKCGEISESEFNDALAARHVEKTEELEGRLHAAGDEGQKARILELIASMETRAEYGRTLSAGYRHYLLNKMEEISACEKTAVTEHQKMEFNSL